MEKRRVDDNFSDFAKSGKEPMPEKPGTC